jgi:hypothetical protein
VFLEAGRGLVLGVLFVPSRGSSRDLEVVFPCGFAAAVRPPSRGSAIPAAGTLPGCYCLPGYECWWGRGLGWEGVCVVIREGGGMVRMRVSPGSSSSRKLGSCKHVPGRVCRYGVLIREVASLLGNQGSGRLVVETPLG